jgi:hypothetical protein
LLTFSIKILKPVEEDDFTSNFSKEIASADEESASQRRLFEGAQPTRHAEFISASFCRTIHGSLALADCFFTINL